MSPHLYLIKEATRVPPPKGFGMISGTQAAVDPALLKALNRRRLEALKALGKKTAPRSFDEQLAQLDDVAAALEARFRR